MVMATVFTIRVVYKCGYVHNFDVTDFTITVGAGGRREYQWKAVADDNKPLLLNPDEIAAVWQVGHKEVPNAVLE